MPRVIDSAVLVPPGHACSPLQWLCRCTLFSLVVASLANGTLSQCAPDGAGGCVTVLLSTFCTCIASYHTAISIVAQCTTTELPPLHLSSFHQYCVSTGISDPRRRRRPIQYSQYGILYRLCIFVQFCQLVWRLHSVSSRLLLSQWLVQCSRGH